VHRIKALMATVICRGNASFTILFLLWWPRCLDRCQPCPITLRGLLTCAKRMSRRPMLLAANLPATPAGKAAKPPKQ
jgi:hypothetical protein